VQPPDAASKARRGGARAVNRTVRYPVLLHGFTGSSESWVRGITEGLASAGLPPALVDLPGHGREAGHGDPPDATLGSALELVARAGSWPADLIGYSMGARIALHFAAAHPERVRRLVLESGSPGLASESERAARRDTDEALAARIVEEGVEAFVTHWESQPLFETHLSLDPEARARQRAIRVRNDPLGLASALRALGTGTLPSLWDRLSSLTTPTLLLVGALDHKFVDIAEEMAATMPDARVVVVPEAGHSVHLEQPARWLAAVARFLSG